MKRIIILAVILLTILIWAGISISNTSSKKSNELVFWTLQLGTFSDYIQPIIDEFEREHPDIKILWVDIPYSEGGKRTLAAILSDTPPDLINATPDFSTLLAQKNTLHTFEKKDVEQYLPSIMKSLTINNGKNYYAIPFYATTAITMYNKDLVKKTGIKELPSTYEQMYSYANDSLKKTNAYITMPTINENDTFLKILNKYDLASAQNINSQKAINLFNAYKKLYQRGLIPKESLTQTHRESLEKFMSGQIIFYNGGANFLNLVKENAPDIYEKTDVIPQITGSNGKYDFSLMNLIIPKNAKNKELALEFAKTLTNEKNQLNFAKMTTVMPVNKYTLKNEYFITPAQDDLTSKARVLSARQLNNTLGPIEFKNQKNLAQIVNRTLAEILLGKIEMLEGLNNLQKSWQNND